MMFLRVSASAAGARLGQKIHYEYAKNTAKRKLRLTQMHYVPAEQHSSASASSVATVCVEVLT